VFNYFWLKFVKVNIDNLAALHFIMQDDIFLLNGEKELFKEVADEKAAIAGAAAVIADTPEEKVMIAQPKAVIKYKGNNTSGYVILVHYPSVEWMHDTHLAALENTLKRKNIEPEDVAIVNMAAHSEITYEQVASQLKPKKILLLGKAALPAGMAAVKFNRLHQLPDCTVLHTFSFDEMMDSNENKKLFWEQMKLL
jgi:hypothetical protein